MTVHQPQLHRCLCEPYTWLATLSRCVVFPRSVKRMPHIGAPMHGPGAAAQLSEKHAKLSRWTPPRMMWEGGRCSHGACMCFAIEGSAGTLVHCHSVVTAKKTKAMCCVPVIAHVSVGRHSLDVLI